jgi:hypothetical protein
MRSPSLTTMSDGMPLFGLGTEPPVPRKITLSMRPDNNTRRTY